MMFSSLLMISQAAWASNDVAADATGQSTIVRLLLIVGVAYLLAHGVVDWLQRRFLVVSGAEYILLGVGIGSIAGSALDLNGLAPILSLAAGWVGLVYGMELNLKRLLFVEDGAIRLAFFDGLGSGLLVAVVSHFVLASGWIAGVNPDQAWLAAGALGCASAAGSSSAIEVVSSRFGLQDGLIATLRRSAGFGDLVSILMFGLLFCIYRPETDAAAAWSLSASGWAWVTLGIGTGLGLLFTVFLGDDDSDNGRFLALVGIICFASGAAFFLDLSLLTVNLILGIVLANSAKDGVAVAQTLSTTRRPMSLLLLLFAGLLWERPWVGDVVDIHAILPAAGLTLGVVILRTTGKLLGAWVGSFGTNLRGDLGRGLLAQGDEALAMAIAMQLVFNGPEINLAYTAILGSVVVHEFLAPRLLKTLLVDAAELRSDAAPAAVEA